ncbi:hypothetical protein Hdeb2414_s0004g00135051 [Helianthus debilis subsp. tardiflorus]
MWFFLLLGTLNCKFGALEYIYVIRGFYGLLVGRLFGLSSLSPTYAVRVGTTYCFFIAYLHNILF